MAYQKGTRRAEELIAEARGLSYTEQYSYTEGWNDNVAVNILNFAIQRLYNAVTQIDSPPNIQETSINVISGQQAYDLPIDVHMALRIMDVRYLYSGPNSPWAYVTLNEGMIQDRFSYPTNIPDTWCLRNGKILLSPTPNITQNKALVINYQKRMRYLDVRRGKVSSISSPNGNIVSISNAFPAEVTTEFAHNMVTGYKSSIQGAEGMTLLNGGVYDITVTSPTSYTLDGVDSTTYAPYTGGGKWFQNPITFQLNFTVNSQKDVQMQANANSILDKVDYCCIVDRFGNPIVDAIPLYGYNQTSLILTADTSFVFSEEQLDLFNAALADDAVLYVVQGDYASTYSELDRECERQLIEYMILRFFRLQSNAEPTKDQADAERQVLDQLVVAYRRYRPSIMPVIMTQRLPKSFPFGPRGIV